MARILNIATAGHVDSGKTTLTDRMMFSGRGDTRRAWGSIEEGTTVTDISKTERLRGITLFNVPAVGEYRIARMAATENYEDYRLTVIDTPGHPELKQQVYNALSCVDGALLLLDLTDRFRNHSACLLQQVRQMEIPYIVVLNKIDAVPVHERERTIRTMLDDIALFGLDGESEVVPVSVDTAGRPFRMGPGSYGEDDQELNANSGMNSPLLPRSIVEKMGHVFPKVTRASIDSLLHENEVPALVVSAKSGDGIAGLLAVMLGYFPSIKLCENGTPARGSGKSQCLLQAISYMPRAGMLSESLMCRVLAGRVMGHTTAINVMSGETSRIKAVYSADCRKVQACEKGEIVLIKGFSRARFKGADIISAGDGCADALRTADDWSGSGQKVEYNLPCVLNMDFIKCIDRLNQLHIYDNLWSKLSKDSFGEVACGNRLYQLSALATLSAEFDISLRYSPELLRVAIRNREESLVSCSVQSHAQCEPVRFAEAMRSLQRSDPSWRFTPFGEKLICYGSNTFHLGVLLDLLRNEYSFILSPTAPSPRYVVRVAEDTSVPVDNPLLLGAGVSLDVCTWHDSVEPDSFDESGLVSSSIADTVRERLLSLGWHGDIRPEGNQYSLTHKSPNVNPKKLKKQGRQSGREIARAIIEKIEWMMNESGNVSLCEPVVMVTARLRTREEMEGLAGFYKSIRADAQISQASQYDLESGTYKDESELPIRSLIEHEGRFKRALRDSFHTFEFKGYRPMPYATAKKVLLNKLGYVPKCMKDKGRKPNNCNH